MKPIAIEIPQTGDLPPTLHIELTETIPEPSRMEYVAWLVSIFLIDPFVLWFSWNGFLAAVFALAPLTIWQAFCAVQLLVVAKSFVHRRRHFRRLPAALKS